jgi:hypothetical protein
MTVSRVVLAAAFGLAMISTALPSGAQPYGAPPPQGYYPPPHHDRIPMFQVAQWAEIETGYTAVWTFEMGAQRRTMSGVWTDQRTGRRVFARGMAVRREGQQIIINRPGLGNYVGTIQPGGREIAGTISWTGGRFRARTM